MRRGIIAKLQLIYLLYFIKLNYGKRFTLREMEQKIRLSYTSIDNLVSRAIEEKYLDIIQDAKPKSFTLVKGAIIQKLRLSSKGIDLVKVIIKDLNTEKMLYAHDLSVFLSLFVGFATYIKTQNILLSIVLFFALALICAFISSWYGKRERLRLLAKLLLN